MSTRSKINSKNDLLNLKERYESGESPSDLAQIFGVSSETIRSTLREAGVKLRNHSESMNTCAA